MSITALAKEIDGLYRDEQHAESQYEAARQAASDVTVDRCREDWSRAQASLRDRIPAIGRDLYDEGGAAAMRAVLGMVDAKNQSRVADEWKSIAGELTVL